MRRKSEAQGGTLSASFVVGISPPYFLSAGRRCSISAHGNDGMIHGFIMRGLSHFRRRKDLWLL
jgi:hypothetical protein